MFSASRGDMTYSTAALRTNSAARLGVCARVSRSDLAYAITVPNSRNVVGGSASDLARLQAKTPSITPWPVTWVLRLSIQTGHGVIRGERDTLKAPSSSEQLISRRMHVDYSTAILQQGTRALRKVDSHLPHWLREHFRPLRAKGSLGAALLISILWLPGVAFFAFPLVYAAIRVAIATWRASGPLGFVGLCVIVYLGLSLLFLFAPLTLIALHGP